MPTQLLTPPLIPKARRLLQREPAATACADTTAVSASLVAATACSQHLTLGTQVLMQSAGIEALLLDIEQNSPDKTTRTFARNNRVRPVCDCCCFWNASRL